MKRKLLPLFAVAISSLIIINSCSKGGGTSSPPPPPPPPPPPGNTCTGTPGPLFSAVRTLLNDNCVSCHNNSIANGGMNWTVDCNAVLNKDRIKARAVDNNPTSMPPTGALPAADKKKITDWIAAGGNLTD